MKKIIKQEQWIMLPADKKTELELRSSIAETQPQHLYLTSDDEIKDGDWFIHINLKKVFKCCKSSGNTIWANNMEMGDMASRCRKIIASTNPNI